MLTAEDEEAMSKRGNVRYVPPETESQRRGLTIGQS
jgi:hypothetical protein|eukprot:SAG25_NODE_1069_length_4127_cov_3.215438_8_plen_36_part_00